MSLEENLKNVVKEIQLAAALAGRNPTEITLVAVSKGQTIDNIRVLYDLGVRDFAENRVVEALEKIQALPSDIRWHFVGKLQKNKISKVLGHFALIHSVDTRELAEKISQASLNAHLRTSVLIQANTSGESTKGGLKSQEWESCYPDLLSYEGIKVDGLMTMAPLGGDETLVRSCFSELRHLAQRLEKMGGTLASLSMGMSQDFSIAIQEGATFVRIGSALFKGSAHATQ